jgi:RHS repeat-associated protein
MLPGGFPDFSGMAGQKKGITLLQIKRAETVHNRGNHFCSPRPSPDSDWALLLTSFDLTGTYQFTCDNMGRLTSATSSYTFLTARSFTTGYTYDSNGNTASKTDSTGTTSYSWDFENRLTSVTLPGSGGAVSFAYDPFGHRIKKVSSAGTSIYAYEGDNLIEEANASGAVVARYAQGPNIDEPLAMLRGGATSFYHADGLGSVTSMSNSAGAIAQTYTFDSFGKLTVSSGSLTNAFRYTGREFDTETSLYFYRARYFDPNVGRFISEDHHAISMLGEWPALYVYVKNDPINLIDPLGLFSLKPGVPYPSLPIQAFGRVH